MSKRIYVVLAFVTIVTWIFLGEKRTVYESTKDKHSSSLERTVFVKTSNIAKSDKHFHKISLDKTQKSLEKHHATKKYMIKIKKLLMMKRGDITTLDQVMHAFLMDKKIVRIEKINSLWGILKEIGFESEQSFYILDSLATLLPIELTQDLIDVYNDSKNRRTKTKLITMLAENTNILNPDKQDKQRLEFITDKIEEVQLFLKENISKESDPQILEEALYAYADISDAEDILALTTSLKNTNNSKALPSGVIDSILTEVSVSTPEAQKEILPKVLENIKNAGMADPKQKEHFTQMMLDAISSGVISEDAQEELGNYLKKEEPKIPMGKTTTETLSKYYTWAEGVSKLKNNDMSLKKIVLESDNPLKISSIVIYADEQTMQKIKADAEIATTYAKLETALRDSRFNRESKENIKCAMDRLKENN